MAGCYKEGDIRPKVAIGCGEIIGMEEIKKGDTVTYAVDI